MSWHIQAILFHYPKFFFYETIKHLFYKNPKYKIQNTSFEHEFKHSCSRVLTYVLTRINIEKKRCGMKITKMHTRRMGDKRREREIITTNNYLYPLLLNGIWKHFKAADYYFVATTNVKCNIIMGYKRQQMRQRQQAASATTQ